jgi:hypothetical protein
MASAQKPTLTVTDPPAYSVVTVSGCGYAQSNAYGVRVSEYYEQERSYWWANAPVDANGVTMQVYGAGTYDFAANEVFGGRVKAVASASITVF